MRLVCQVLICAILLLQSGCATILAIKKPISRPPDELIAGLHRSSIDAKYGFPIAMGKNEAGEHTEQIQFIDGVGIARKVVWSVLHPTLDLCTLFAWELIGTPMEIARRYMYPIHTYYLVYDQEGVLLRAIDAQSEEGEAYSRLPWVKPFNPKLKLNLDGSLRYASGTATPPLNTK